MNFNLKDHKKLQFGDGWRYYSGLYPDKTRFGIGDMGMIITRKQQDPSCFGPKYNPRSEIVSAPFKVGKPFQIVYTVLFPYTESFHETIFQLCYEKNGNKEHPALALMFRGRDLKIRRAGELYDMEVGNWNDYKGELITFTIDVDPLQNTTNITAVDDMEEIFFQKKWINSTEFTLPYEAYYSFGLYSTIKKPTVDVQLGIQNLTCFPLVKEEEEEEEEDAVDVYIDSLVAHLREFLDGIK